MTTSRPAALIVEDQPFVGMIASDILRECGFDTFHAYDATAATVMLEAHPEIEVVITEAQLPGDVDGLALARRLSQSRPDIQLVVTSAEKDLAGTDIPQGARMLHKPYASGELRTLVAAKSLLADA